MIDSRQPRGFTLLEVIAAVVIAASLALLSIHHLRGPSETGKQRSCAMNCQRLQESCDRYVETNALPPSRDLRELASDQYIGNELPVCPSDGRPYQLDDKGTVICPHHSQRVDGPEPTWASARDSR